MSNQFLPRGLKHDFGWYDGKNLPHFDANETTQFITIRLADSIPREKLDEWREIAKTDAAFRRRVESHLDNGAGECHLARPEIAEIVEKALLFHHAKMYVLLAWVIMPNHLHFLIRPLPGKHLDKILHSIKSFTSHEANRLLSRNGPFWQAESFDRYIRNRRHLIATIRYIHRNPVKARLCREAKDWRYSSASRDWIGE